MSEEHVDMAANRDLSRHDSGFIINWIIRHSEYFPSNLWSDKMVLLVAE
jgi:hypothetical protein